MRSGRPARRLAVALVATTVLALAVVLVATTRRADTPGAPDAPEPSTIDHGPPPLPAAADHVPPGALAGIEPGPGGPVAVFGDSLTLQSWPYLVAVAQAQGRPLLGAAYGGAALCDWIDEIDETLLDDAPVEIVLAFVGNSLTPCMIAPGGAPLAGDELIARYVDDAELVVERARAAGVRVVLVGPPAVREEPWAQHAAGLRAAFAELASRAGVAFVDLVPVLSPDGPGPSLPCLVFETPAVGCHDGRIAVRAADGTHLAPPPDRGPAYSSGAWRYATALLGA